MDLLRVKIFKYLLCFCLCAVSSLSAANSLVIESPHISDIMNYLEDEPLIILDIDNTLIKPAQQLGSDQWAWNQVKEWKATGLSEKEAIDKTMEDWRKIHAVTKMQTLESSTAQVIHELQDKGFSVIAITTRTPEDALLTVQELHEVDIDLTLTSVLNHPKSFDEKIKFSEGILFISLENQKGNALTQFLSEIGYHPRKIIFVDDKLSHIKSVETACASQDIHYTGIRYAGADADVASFNPNLAKIQLFFLKNILSDEQASLLSGWEKID